MSRPLLSFLYETDATEDLLPWFYDQAPALDSVPEDSPADLDLRYTYDIQLWRGRICLTNNVDERGEARAIQFPTLIQRYLARKEPQGPPMSVQVEATLDNDDGRYQLLYLITPTGWKEYDMDALGGLLRPEWIARFFRERVCLVCEMDVLSEGGRHTEECPVGLLLGTDGVMWRP